MKRVTKWAQLACHASHISREDWSRRCPVGDLLVDPDQGYLLCRRSPPRALVGQNHHRVISRVCRYTNFAVGDALEHDRNLVGLEQHFASHRLKAFWSAGEAITEKIDRRRIARENVRFLLCHRIGPLADGFSNSANPIIRTVLRVKFSFAILSGVSRQSRTVVFHFGPNTLPTSCAALLRATAAAQY